jgi:hypothetical protein
MSADDFKAQATTQSIGATSIPSQESFGTATLADNRRIVLSSGVVSTVVISQNASLAEVGNLAVAYGISSSENLLDNNSFGTNTYFAIPSISSLLRDSDSTGPTLTSSIGITISPVNSQEVFPNPVVGDIRYISFSGNGINSLESLGTHTFNSITYITQEVPIPSEENFNLNQFSLFNNIYPSTIDSSEAFQNDNIFGNIIGIVLTTGIHTAFSSPSTSTLSLLGSVQHITLNSGIVSGLSFGRRTTFYPPPPSYLRRGFIYGYTVVINNIFVTLERENLLDTVTKIPRKIENLQSRSETINGYIETKNIISSNIDIVYSIEGEIVQEQTLIARQTKYYLESYIKQKHKIDSNIYVDQNDNFYSTRSGKIN